MNKIFYILIIGLVTLIGCDDFFEEDLTGKIVVLVAPADGLETSSTSFTFWWNEVDGATKYNLQIVSPNFDAIEKLVLDTNLTGSQYNVQLYPGFFQWRVKAFNGSSATLYTTYTLTVDSTLDLSSTQVILSEPVDNYACNDTSIEFSWNTISIADKYEIRIYKDNWETGTLVKDEDTTSDNIILDVVSEGTYVWGVRASNIYSVSKFGTSNLIIDRTAPQKPTLDSPAQGEETSTDVTFNWSRPDESGSAITDSIYVSTDSTFVAEHEIADKTAETTYSWNNIDIGSSTSQKFYWCIRSIDKAGNKSDYSAIRRFTVKK